MFAAFLCVNSTYTSMDTLIYDFPGKVKYLKHTFSFVFSVDIFHISVIVHGIPFQTYLTLSKTSKTHLHYFSDYKTGFSLPEPI